MRGPSRRPDSSSSKSAPFTYGQDGDWMSAFMVNRVTKQGNLDLRGRFNLLIIVRLV